MVVGVFLVFPAAAPVAGVALSIIEALISSCLPASNLPPPVEEATSAEVGRRDGDGDENPNSISFVPWAAAAAE